MLFDNDYYKLIYLASKEMKHEKVDLLIVNCEMQAICHVII